MPALLVRAHQDTNAWCPVAATQPRAGTCPKDSAAAMPIIDVEAKKRLQSNKQSGCKFLEGM